jgi:hypothetical protein
MKPCRNCFYYAPGRYSGAGQCTRFIAYRGRGRIVYDFTVTARVDESKCGLAGRYFVAREKKVSSERQRLLSSLLEDEE